MGGQFLEAKSISKNREKVTPTKSLYKPGTLLSGYTSKPCKNSLGKCYPYLAGEETVLEVNGLPNDSADRR